jgi:hypothetical protein
MTPMTPMTPSPARYKKNKTIFLIERVEKGVIHVIGVIDRRYPTPHLARSAVAKPRTSGNHRGGAPCV